MSDTSANALLVGVFLGVFVLGIIVGCCAENNLMRREAVKNNCAEWVADDKGRAQFKWRAPNND